MTDEEALLLLGVVMLVTWKPHIDWGTGWAWPVPDGGGTPALVTQEYRWPSHHGVDITYKLATGFGAPEGTPVLAARAGSVYSVTTSPRGTAVVLDHGPPWATFYQHLESATVVKGQHVAAGDQLGLMGADPTDPQGIRHLHFETWYNGTTDQAVDPAPMLATAKRSIAYG